MRKIGRGKPLQELVKGSYDYTLRLIRDSFSRQFGWEDFWPYIVETFEDYVIVKESSLPPDEYYYVSFERTDQGYVFADRDDWEVVELAYQPASPLEESAGKKYSNKRFKETVPGTVRLRESKEENPDGPWKIEAIGITADVVNANGRRYSARVLEAAVKKMQTHLHESAGQGRILEGSFGIQRESVTTGEPDHPSDKGNRSPQLLETVVNWTGVEFDGRHVLLEGLLLGTRNGKDVRAQMKGGVIPGVSQRAYGDSEIIRESGRLIEEVQELTITGYDLTAPNNQSDYDARVTMFESKQEGDEMDPQQLLEMLQASGFFDQLAESVRRQVEDAMRQDDADRKETALREALGIGPEDDITEAVLGLLKDSSTDEFEAQLRESLGLNDTDDLNEALHEREKRLRELEEKERARQVSAYITEQTDSLQYPDWLREKMVEAVQTMSPKTVEEAKEVLIEKRKEYDGIMAQLEMATRGYGGSGMHILGPVLERETGTPEFARGAHMLVESMVRSGRTEPRKWNRPLDEMSRNERFARMVLERFDELYMQFLLEESRRINEAEQTSDLSLPYSVARAIIAEAVPDLIAASIFDVGLTDQSPSRIYYEDYSGESGSYESVSDESVTVVALDTWYDLDYKRVRPGSVTVTNSGGDTTYVEGTDYVIDYGNGRVRALTGGSISAADVIKVDYTYDAIRLGEMEAIERAKMTLTYKTLEIEADRLATQISSEAIVFARSQLGWDATGRTLSGLVRKIRELIDQHLLWRGLSAALTVANNSGGTWSATPAGGDTYDENLDKLIRYIGVAKVKVANRYYDPNFILTSKTNGDLLSNSKLFSAAGKRPDMDINAAGYVGRIKGLPVFESTQFSDAYILVGNRELVMHRIFKPMILKGPFPSYSDGQLVAADQYYAEEYNGTDAPVPEKGSYVILSS